MEKTPSKVFIHVHVFRFLWKAQLHQCDLLCTARSPFTWANLVFAHVTYTLCCTLKPWYEALREVLILKFGTICHCWLSFGVLSYAESLTGSKVYILWSIHWTKYTCITSTLVNRTLHFVICRNLPTSEKVELYKSWLVKQGLEWNH